MAGQQGDVPEARSGQESSASEPAPLIVFLNPDEGSSTVTSFSSDETSDLASEQGEGPNNSSEDDGKDLPDRRASPSGAVAIPSKASPGGSESVSVSMPLAEVPPAAPAKEPAKAAPAEAIWTKEMTAQERNRHSRVLINDLIQFSERLERATTATRDAALRACFSVLNRLADPGLADWRSNNLIDALNKQTPGLKALNQAMQALSKVIDNVPSEKRKRCEAILQEWNALIATDGRLARVVPDSGIILESAVTAAIGQVDFAGA
jgi:hypothetical protein